MRIAFTIIFNGLHHLKHNNQYEKILNDFDKWVVVEGASKSSGSTSWCKTMPSKYHSNGKSVDGTVEFMEDLYKKNENLIFIPSNGFWDSKDHQVNVAIEEIKKITNKCFLWEIDIDEQWTSDSIELAEKELRDKKLKMGRFYADCYVGKNLIAVGVWGESVPHGYNRLWDWSGEHFEKHEPPTLYGGNGRNEVLTPRFKHYNYFFEEDVKFKNDWYGGHEGIHERWKRINQLEDNHFPLHISNLITGHWGRTDTFLVKV